MGKVLLAVLLSFSLLFAGDVPNLKSGIEKENFDKSVRPQDDFYKYANGTWVKNTEIPAEWSTYGVFHLLFEKAEKDLKEIIESTTKLEASPGTDEQKVGDFYRSFLDSTLTEKLGIKPLEKELANINSVKSKSDLAKLFAHFELIGTPKPFGLFVDQDLKQNDQYITYLSQGGLGLPNRDYYFNSGEKFEEIRTKYVEYIKNIFELAGISDASVKAKSIMDIETDIAKDHWTPVENRDMTKTYNKFELSKLDEEADNFDWTTFYKESGMNNISELIVQQPSYFEAFNKLIKKVSLDDWKNYATWKVLNANARLLSQDFVDLRFGFYGTTLRGTEKMRPRWKRAVFFTNNLVGEVVGKVYVKKHFKPEAKERMVKLVKNLQKSFEQRIHKLDWMGPETKKEALAKLSKFVAKIGYPDKWKDYSKLEIKKDDLVGNFARSNQFEHNYHISKLGKPIDKSEWQMMPQEVNAYYNPPMNEIVFPAAILQPPFFNLEADDAVNYGAIGTVIGHELTHGFDDQGRKIDGTGNMRDWWTEKDTEKFTKRAQVMVDQYSKFNPVDTIYVNGELTLGENIADLGGLTISYYAYKMSLEGNDAPVIDGLTGEQRFFHGYAQVWASLYRDKALIQQIKTDPHSPGMYRVNGVVSNMPEFYEAFEVKEGDPMYRSEDIRVKIW